MKIWCMRISCWTTKATNTHSEYVIHMTFPRQQLLRELSSVLRYSTLSLLFDVITSDKCAINFFWFTKGDRNERESRLVKEEEREPVSVVALTGASLF